MVHIEQILGQGVSFGGRGRRGESYVVEGLNSTSANKGMKAKTKYVTPFVVVKLCSIQLSGKAY